VNTMWFGFSFQYIRDDVFASVPDQFEIARDVFDWWQYAMSPGCCYVDAEAPAAFKLAQNYPNPFNPSTTIRFGMKAKGLVTVKIYDVAGRLVRTLVNEVRDAGAYSAVWDGRNNLGAHVASGIYFYKMETKGFSATKKLVLLR
jgi:thiol-disulfide isomerase/thioredoxin